MSSSHTQNPQHSETVEASGHLIDSHIMEQIFDTVVEFNGRFEVEDFHIGRTNSDPSRLRMRIEAPRREDLDRMVAQLLGFGCTPVDHDDVTLERVEREWRPQEGLAAAPTGDGHA